MTYSSDAVLFVIDVLNDMGSPYIITDSLATTLYTSPRGSVAADFVVEMEPDELEALFRRLDVRFQQERQMTFETVTGKVQHKFRHRDTPFLVEIFEARMDDPHERARFDRRQSGQVEGRSAFVPTAEDVVVQKLRWAARIARPKDRDDAMKVMAHQWSRLDWAYVEKWADEHGTRALMEQLRSEAKRFLESLGLPC